MHHIILAASPLTSSRGKLSEDAYYEIYGTDPFAGLRQMIQAIVGLVRRLRLRRPAPSGHSQPAAML